MFKPHVTVACVVQANDLFLIVEETINGKALWNQPAGHLEADETIIAAARRELYEETGIQAAPQYLLHIHQWIAPDSTPFIRFLFSIDLPGTVEITPHDSDIDCGLWLPPKTIINAANLRSPLVRESILCYQRPERYPLSLVAPFNWPFAGDV